MRAYLKFLLGFHALQSMGMWFAILFSDSVSPARAATFVGVAVANALVAFGYMLFEESSESSIIIPPRILRLLGKGEIG